MAEVEAELIVLDLALPSFPCDAERGRDFGQLQVVPLA